MAMNRIGQNFKRVGMLMALLWTPMLLAACAGDNAGPILPERPPPQPVRGVEGMSLSEMMALGESFVEAGEPRAAIALFDRAADMAPQEPAPLLRMGRLFLDAGDVDVAERVYRQALDRDARNVQARLALAEIALLRAEPESALAHLDALSGLQGEQLREATNLRGLAHDLAGRHEQAQLAYAEALAEEPESAAAMTNLALSLALSGETAAARDILQELAETETERRRALENLALVHALAGQQSAAMRAAMEAVGADFARDNSVFYSRLAGLDGVDRVRAVLLGELPSGSSQAAADGSEEATADMPETLASGQDAVAETAPAPAPTPEPDPAPQMSSPAQDQSLASPPGDEAADESETASAQGQGSAEAAAPADDAGEVVAPDYVLQLGSFRDTERVRRHWEALSAAGLMQDMQGFSAGVPGEAGMRRLLVGPVRGYSRSSARCAAIRDAGHACLVRVAPDGMEPLADGE